VQASSITRSLSSSSVNPEEMVTVTLEIKITEGETFYLIDDSVPSGWTVVSSDTGDFTDPGHVKWAVIQNAADVNYTYVAGAPKNPGTYSFSGKYMFERMKTEGSVAGQQPVDVLSPAPAANSNQQQPAPGMPVYLFAGVLLLLIVLAAAAVVVVVLRRRSKKRPAPAEPEAQENEKPAGGRNLFTL